MVVRLCLLMLVAWVRGVHLFMENPMSTVIHFFSPLRELIGCILKHKVTVFLSSYGSPCPKPIMIWSTTSHVQRLWRRKGGAQERLTTSENGSVTGCRKALKASQAYPTAFGEAVASIFVSLAKERSLDDLLEEDANAVLAAALSSGAPSRKRKRA